MNKYMPEMVVRILNLLAKIEEEWKIPRRLLGLWITRTSWGRQDWVLVPPGADNVGNFYDIVLESWVMVK